MLKLSMAYKVTIKGDSSVLKQRTFKCEACGHSWSDLVQDGPSSVPCTHCPSTATVVFSAANVAGFSIKDKATQTEMLKKRSSDHSKKLVASEPEKFGFTGKKK